MGDVVRSISSDALNMFDIEPLEPGTRNTWCHGRSYSDTERSLDMIVKDLENMLCEDMHGHQSSIDDMHGHQSSTDSAIGESECISSPLQQADPVGYTNRYNSMDSAISNHSSHHSLSETDNSCVDIDTIDCPFNSGPAHLRMSSGISIHSESPGLSNTSPTRRLSNGRYGTLEATSSLPDVARTDLRQRSTSPMSFRKSNSTISFGSSNSKSSRSSKSGKFKKPQSQRKKKYLNGSLDNFMPLYDPHRSPILNHKVGKDRCIDVIAVHAVPSSNKPIDTDAYKNITPRFHYVLDKKTEVLI